MVASDQDVTGGLASLLLGASQVLGADSAAILVRAGKGLEVLAASSHRAEDLEIHQAQEEEGPCVESIDSGEPVVVLGAGTILSRWPTVGRHIVDAGYVEVGAAPMTWHGECFGALNIFGRSLAEDRVSRAAEARALADTATLLVLCQRETEGLLTRSLDEALAQRATVERAKGALGHVRSISMPAAFEALQQLAEAEGLTLGAAARVVMRRARNSSLR